MGAPSPHEVASGAAAPARGDDAYGASADTVRWYLRRAGSHPLLDASEERRLAQAMEAGRRAEAALARSQPTECRNALRDTVERGRAARSRFIEANLRLVVAVARRYATPQFPILDCIQEGNLGLLKAVDRFDWRRGSKFSTHATWWIRQAITSALTDKARTVRIPRHVAHDAYRVGRTRDALLASLSRAPSVEEIAGACSLSQQEVAQVLEILRGPLSINQNVGDDGTELGELIEDADSEDPVVAVEHHLRDEALGTALTTLSPPERAVINLRYGLDTGIPRTLADVGAELGLTRMNVRRVEAEAISKLRESPCARSLGPA